MPAPAHQDLLRALPHGARLWLRAGGRSLWPVVLDGDQLQVERGDALLLRPGDIALVVNPGGQLVAHLVASTAPFVTVSSVGVVDPPAREVLGRVVAVRRGAFRLELPRYSHVVLRAVPRLAGALKRVPGLRALVRRVRDR
jgi:mycothiol synthase